MNILFCGSCLPREFESRIADLSVAGNQYQNNLINSLKDKGQVHVLSYIGIVLEIPEKTVLGACNQQGYRPVIAHNKTTAFVEYRKELKKKLKWADIVITYNVMYPWLKVGSMAKKVYTRSVLVLADYTPPAEETGSFRKTYSRIMEKDFKNYSKIVLLSPGSKKYVDKVQESIVINGCLDLKKFENVFPPNEKDNIALVYSGVLSAVTGIDLLLESFKQIVDTNLRLIICGQGNEMNEMIKDASITDPRIDCRGFLSTEKYLKTIEEADILINPRNMNFAQNQNNFPSKILEYIASGRKIVSTKFMGWETYKDYIWFVDSTPDSLTEGIILAAKEPHQGIYDRNREFAKTFEWKYQINKFL